MEVGDAGCYQMNYVTYWLQYSQPIPGIEIRFTCAHGPVQRSRGLEPSPTDTLDITEMNSAYEAGLRVKVESREPEWPFVDTLRTDLDLSEAARRAHVGEAIAAADSFRVEMFDALVLSTVDCILLNAARSGPPIRHLDLRVEGPERYARFERVYDIPAPPDSLREMRCY